MVTRIRQRGFLLIIGAILILVGAMFATVVTFLFIGRSESGIEHMGGGQALFLAESGRERALAGLVLENTHCSQVSFPSQSFGAGNFSSSASLSIARIGLDSNVAAGDSVIPVSSTAGFARHGRIRLSSSSGDEEANYSGLSTSCAPFGSAACFTGVHRGVAGTSALAHTAPAASVSQEQCLITSIGSVPDIGSQRTIDSARRYIPAMMVYSKSTATPFYRLWEGTGWGPEQTALNVSSDIRYMRVAHARTRNEAVLVTQDNQGRLNAQVWNGISWGNHEITFADHANPNERGFDVAYETKNDRALVVFNTGATGTADAKIWRGVPPWVTADQATLSNTGGFGTPRWIVMAPNPLATSNEISVIIGSSGNDVYGLRWDGSTWDQMGAPSSWNNNTSTTSSRIAVAYSQLSGQALFVWGRNSNDILDFRTMSGGTLGGLSTIATTLNGRITWLRLASDPYSDRILCGVQSSGRDLVTRSWSGTGWNADTRSHDIQTEDQQERNFDLVFETHPTRSGKVWVMWGNGAAVAHATCTFPTCAWATGGLTGDDNTSYVRLFAHPKTGSVFAGVYEHADAGGGADDIREAHLTLGGTTWSATETIWAGPTDGDPQFERVDISAGRFLPRVDWPEIFQ